MNPIIKLKNHPQDDKFLLKKYCFMSAGFSMLIMLIIFIFHNNSLLFGESTVLRMDLYHQYGPLYAEVFDRLTQGNSLIYSWTSGLGGSFLGNLFNYCSSPMALILLLLGHKNMPEAIALMMMFKAMLASTAFTYYVNKSNNCVRKESVIFGLFYAFSGYFVAFSWNIMWFDAIAVFPLLILGIEYIIQKNKPSLYIVAMTYTMITNYYMAYMVCILSVMYFLYFYFGRYELSSKIYKAVVDTEVVISDSEEISASDNTLTAVSEEAFDAVNEDSAEFTVEVDASEQTAVISEENAYNDCVEALAQESVAEAPVKAKKIKKTRLKDNRFWVTGWSFALSSFLCFCLAAFALIPVYFCLQSSSATAGTFPEDSKLYFDIFTFISNHLPGVEATIRSSGDNVIPNVYCGLLTVLLLPIYFLSSKIRGKQKVATTILLMTCFAGFVLNYFNFIWHGFHMPNDLPYRWSFAYSFFLLIIAFKAFDSIKEFSNKAYVGLGFAVMSFLVLVERFDIPNCNELTIILSVVFCVLYIVIFGMMRSEKYKKNAIVGLLFFTVILEIIAADAPKIVMQQSKELYTSDYENYLQVSELTEKDDDELFFRTELSKLRARMDPSWYGYNGVSIFSSMAYDHTSKTMKKMGLFGNNINSYTYYPQTAVFNSMFNIRYLYDNMDFINNEDIYTEVSANEDFTSYKYKYYLPLIVSVDDKITEWDYSSADPFVVQNNLMSSATGVSDILIPVGASTVSDENLNDISVATINNSTSFSVSKTNNGSDAKAIVTLKADTAGNYYIYSGSLKLSSINIKADNGFSYNYVSSSIQPFTIDIGYLEEGQTATVTYNIASGNNSASLTFRAARLDNEKFEEAYKIIKNNGTIKLSLFDETSFEGTINVKNNNSFLWTSVPYDESWQIYVDGKLMTYTSVDEETDEVIYDGEIEKVGGGLIGIEIEPGEHTVSFKYNAKGLGAGLMLTAIGAVLLVLLIIYKKYFAEFFKNKGFELIVLRKPEFENN